MVLFWKKGLELILSNVNRRFCGLEISGRILLSREWQIAASRADWSDDLAVSPRCSKGFFEQLFLIRTRFAHWSQKDGDTWLHPDIHIHRHRLGEEGGNRCIDHCYRNYGDIDSNLACHDARHDVVACSHGAAHCCSCLLQLLELSPTMRLRSFQCRQQHWWTCFGWGLRKLSIW